MLIWLLCAVHSVQATVQSDVTERRVAVTWGSVDSAYIRINPSATSVYTPSCAPNADFSYSLLVEYTFVAAYTGPLRFWLQSEYTFTLLSDFGLAVYAVYGDEGYGDGAYGCGYGCAYGGGYGCTGPWPSQPLPHDSVRFTGTGDTSVINTSSTNTMNSSSSADGTARNEAFVSIPSAAVDAGAVITFLARFDGSAPTDVLAVIQLVHYTASGNYLPLLQWQPAPLPPPLQPLPSLLLPSAQHLVSDVRAQPPDVARDASPPKITLFGGGEVTLDPGAAYTDAGAIAVDFDQSDPPVVMVSGLERLLRVLAGSDAVDVALFNAKRRAYGPYFIRCERCESSTCIPGIF